MLFILIAILIFLALFLHFLFRVELRSILTFYLFGLIIFMFSFTVAEMPPFGSIDAPAFNEVPRRYLESGVPETGAINIASSIINDYRAFDTLGEATVLFAAIAAVIATLKSH
jgi:multisubunit Na+/H+ antiporter MnhB subunit